MWACTIIADRIHEGVRGEGQAPLSSQLRLLRRRERPDVRRPEAPAALAPDAVLAEEDGEAEEEEAVASLSAASAVTAASKSSPSWCPSRETR